jgi:hypothetical protein
MAKGTGPPEAIVEIAAIRVAGVSFALLTLTVFISLSLSLTLARAHALSPSPPALSLNMHHIYIYTHTYICLNIYRNIYLISKHIEIYIFVCKYIYTHTKCSYFTGIWLGTLPPCIGMLCSCGANE